MPIFMDRHDVSETVTAEHVAQLHQEDLKIQDQFGCRGLTYWFDERRKTAFCLIEAPDQKAIQEMHNQAHGQIPHSIIEVEPSIVESFLGRIEDPVKAKNTSLNIINDPGFRTIMVIAIQPCSLLLQGTRLVDSTLSHFTHSVPAILEAHEGRLVKKTSDYFLVSFESVKNAVQAALALQLEFMQFKKTADKNSLGLKIGLSAGVPVTKKEAIFEDTIKLAERMVKVIEGEVIISAEVKELYDSENTTTITHDNNWQVLSKADEKFLTLLMEYTESCLSNTSINVDDVGKAVGCSKSKLYRKLTLLTGKSPNSFIRDYRLSEAVVLLGKNTGNVSEVAFTAGFSSPSYFSKCFLKKFGLLPSDYLPAKEG